MEKNIEVDENDNVIGLRNRDDFYSGKYIHRSSHLILINSNNEIFLQKRASDKKWYPNLYTFSVSETVADETYEQAIKKGMKEEIGINIKVKKLFTYCFFDDVDKAWHCVFIGFSDNKLNPDKGEIQSVKWISFDKVKKDIFKNPKKYTPPFVKGMKIFFNKFYSDLEKFI